MAMDSFLRILSSLSCLLSCYSSFPSSSSFSTITNAISAKPKPIAVSIPSSSNPSPKKTHLSPFQAERNIGILVALPDESDTQNPQFVLRKPLFSCRKKHKYRSAPVNVPRMQRREIEEEEEEEEMMLMPHEIVDRARKRNESLAASSVLEGVGRKLKGRDLTRFRHAVFQKTGFLDGVFCPLDFSQITILQYSDKKQGEDIDRIKRQKNCLI